MMTGKLVNKLTETNSIKFTDYAINRFQGSEEQSKKSTHYFFSISEYNFRIR